MWLLEKDFTFEAAHVLPNHDGKCARLHGHSWRGTVAVEGSVLHTTGPKQGMIADFSDLKRPIQWLLDTALDHVLLNESTGLENPTSEELARWVYNQLKPHIPFLTAVTIQETCTSRATYSPEDSR